MSESYPGQYDPINANDSGDEEQPASCIVPDTPDRTGFLDLSQNSQSDILQSDVPIPSTPNDMVSSFFIQ